jgi:hypothetical protein
LSTQISLKMASEARSAKLSLASKFRSRWLSVAKLKVRTLVSKCFKFKVLTRRFASLSHIKSQKSQIARKSQTARNSQFAKNFASKKSIAIALRLRFFFKTDCDCAAIAKTRNRNRNLRAFCEKRKKNYISGSELKQKLY